MNPMVVTPGRSARTNGKVGQMFKATKSTAEFSYTRLQFFYRVRNKKTSKQCFVCVLKPKLHVITAPGGMAFDDSYTQAAELGFQTNFLSCDCL